MALRNLALAASMACASSALFAADDDKPRPRIRLGGVMIGAGYSHWSGGPFYPYYSRYSPWYDPFYYGWLHPRFYTGFSYQPNMGEVKLKSAPKDSDVYLDGAYAGTAGKLKNMWLQPGAYNLEVRSGDRSFKKRIYVLSGKTLDIGAGKMQP